MTPRIPNLDPTIDRWKVALILLLFTAVLVGAITWTSSPWGGLLP